MQPAAIGGRPGLFAPAHPTIDLVALATGSDAEGRCEIMRIAECRALDGLPAARKTYFGDGVWDGQAAKELGWGFIAVGNGAGHHTGFPDLSDLPSILGQLGLVLD